MTGVLVPEPHASACAAVRKLVTQSYFVVPLGLKPAARVVAGLLKRSSSFWLDAVALRLFVAILLSDQVRAALARVQKGLERSCDGVRWVRQDQVHVTVKFLGDVPDGDVPAVTEAIARGAAEGEPFSMTVEAAGCFPPGGGVRIVWAGATEPSNTMQRSVEAVNRELEDLGFERERRAWSAHITIGRVKLDNSAGRIRSAVERVSYSGIAQAVDSVSLMSSVLGSKGPTYEQVFTCPLGKV